MRFDNLTDEQRKQVKACKTPEELLSLAQEQGYELSDIELEAISGGDTWDCFADGCESLLSGLPE